MTAGLGDLAEAIMAQDEYSKDKQEAIQEAAAPAQTPDGQVDLTHVSVPNSFVNEVLGVSTLSEDDEEEVVEEAEGVEEVEVVQQSVEEVPSGDNVISEIREIKTLLSELKTLYYELTTVGSLGVNIAGKSKICDPFKEKQESTDMESRIKKILKKRKK